MIKAKYDYDSHKSGQAGFCEVKLISSKALTKEQMTEVIELAEARGVSIERVGKRLFGLLGGTVIKIASSSESSSRSFVADFYKLMFSPGDASLTAANAMFQG